MTNKEIEQIEYKYLSKYYHFLKYTETEMMNGFNTKEKIRKDWDKSWGAGISDFSTGAERIVYSLLNGKGIGQPNSCPVGADMFFEVDDAFIHIDLKTVQTDNIGDFNTSIFVGTNQNSYKSEITKANGTSFTPKRNYKPALPKFYNKGKKNEKICLSYFITILYDKNNLDILNINLLSMPNGDLIKHYKNRVLSAGKINTEARFNFKEVSKFELIDKTSSRIRIINFDETMNSNYKKKLKFIEEIYNSQPKDNF